MQGEKQELEQQIRRQLFAMQDLQYRDFQSRLIPNVDPERVIGVRTPQLRKFARQLAGTSQAEIYRKILPHDYYEENNLHAFLIEGIRDYDGCMEALEQFLPYIDNWATCDGLAPKALEKHLPELLEHIRIWIRSEHTYTVRFGLGMLMRCFLDAEFQPQYLELAASVQSEEYYIRMMVAWYFATALAKQYDAAVPFIREKRLEVWTHNKTIQKAIESYRVTPEQKAYLRTLKISR